MLVARNVRQYRRFANSHRLHLRYPAKRFGVEVYESYGSLRSHRRVYEIGVIGYHCPFGVAVPLAVLVLVCADVVLYAESACCFAREHFAAAEQLALAVKLAVIVYLAELSYAVAVYAAGVSPHYFHVYYCVPAVVRAARELQVLTVVANVRVALYHRGRVVIIIAVLEAHACVFPSSVVPCRFKSVV